MDQYPRALGGNATENLSPDQLLVTIAGFREMVAGILWVRADSFFEEGNYDAILPIIRLVTWLDPRQLDVYATGMWHMAYNFTDEESRSDRRYIPSAVALGREGSQNNDYTYELFFETGWLFYHKIDDDYGQAVKWWEAAHTKKDMQTARRNILAMAYMRNGQLNDTTRLYRDLLTEAEEAFEGDNVFTNRQNRDTLESNYDNHLMRMVQRGNFAQERGDFDQGLYDTKPPFDVRFSARVTVTDSKVLQVEGTWGVQPVGSRIRMVLRDKDFPNALPAQMVWDQADRVDLDPPKDITWVQDGLFVRNQRFNRRIDLSRDPTMYPFRSENYIIEFYYNPRSAPPHIQDKFGFNGEGMTDQNFLNTEIRPGTRVLYATLEITRDQLLRRGQYALDRETPIVQTKNFVAPSGAAVNDVLEVPGIRSAQPEQPQARPERPRIPPTRTAPTSTGR
jgi:hypothetical protein